MQNILNFVIKNKTFLLFLLLFSSALFLTIQSHSYHKSKFINSANTVTGGIYSIKSGISSYFNLEEKNTLLLEENKRLREQIFNQSQSENSNLIDTNLVNNTFKIIPAKVYKNSYSLPNNFITINKGKRDSLYQDYGVITSKGIVGVVDNTSTKFASVLSILSKMSKVSAQLKSTNHFGSLEWNMNSPQFVQLIDVSKFAPVKVGDTIVTSGRSTIFPKNIDIGQVSSIVLDSGGDTYTLEVKLFNDMTNLDFVYIIINTDAKELKTLQNSINE